MGWASVSYLGQEIWDEVRAFIPNEERRRLAKFIFDKCCDLDADDWEPDSNICKDAGEYQD